MSAASRVHQAQDRKYRQAFDGPLRICPEPFITPDDVGRLVEGLDAVGRDAG